MLSYARTELIPLGTVGAVGSDDYYRKLNNFSLSSAGSPFQIVGQFRLNPFLLNNFSGGLNNYGLLCEMNCP